MIKNTILKFLKLDGFVESLTGYLETRVELLKLEVKEDIAKSLAKVSFFFLLALAFVFFIFFISVTLAFWIAKYTAVTTGFGIVGMIYLVVAILLFLLRAPIGKSLEKKMLEIVKKK